jgi:hypothetical protein
LTKVVSSIGRATRPVAMRGPAERSKNPPPKAMKSSPLYLAVLLSGAALALGCSGEGETDRPTGIDHGGMGGAGVHVGGCNDDEERSCSVTFHQANGAKSCFTGLQFCEAGMWSDCFEPEHDPRVE